MPFLNFTFHMIINICSTLLHKLNKSLLILNEHPKTSFKREEILEEIDTTKNNLINNNSSLEDTILSRIDKIYKAALNTNHTNVADSNIIKIIQNNDELIGMIGNVVKPMIEEIDIGKENTCECKVPLMGLDTGHDNVVINSFIHITSNNLCVLLDSITNMTMTNNKILLHAYTHSYRTYLPFTCFFLIKISNTNYLIDTLKFKSILADKSLHSLWGCGCHKYLSRKTYNTLKEEFKVGICCYRTVEVNEVYLVDYRIRPLDDEMLRIRIGEESFDDDISKDMRNITVSDVANADSKILSSNILEQLLKLRDFIAKSNNESVGYVLTNTQIKTLMDNLPKNKEEFKMLVGRCSPLLRAHIEDVLFIINGAN